MTVQVPDGTHYLLIDDLPLSGVVEYSVCIKGNDPKKTFIVYNEATYGYSDIDITVKKLKKIWLFENVTIEGFTGGFQGNVALTNVEIWFYKEYWEEGMGNLSAANTDFMAYDCPISQQCMCCQSCESGCNYKCWTLPGINILNATLLSCRFHNCRVSKNHII